MIRIADYPQLSFIAWNRRKDSYVTEEEALAFYEGNWRFVEEDELTEAEKKLIEDLVRRVGNGVLNV